MPPTFGRPCDWKWVAPLHFILSVIFLILSRIFPSKHMDKHDCPFRCHEPGCTREKGFTDSGGLLHHQREVHQKYTNARMPIMCPYADCGRSSGNGFTRRENLREHLRRRHQHADDFGRNNRLHDATKDLSEANDGGNIRKEFTQLYREVQVYDRRLEELECKVAVLQSAIARSS